MFSHFDRKTGGGGSYPALYITFSQSLNLTIGQFDSKSMYEVLKNNK